MKCFPVLRGRIDLRMSLSAIFSQNKVTFCEIYSACLFHFAFQLFPFFLLGLFLLTDYLQQSNITQMSILHVY